MKANTAEKVLARVHSVALAVLQRNGYVSIELILYKAVKSVHTKVYGVEAGEEGVLPAGKIQALVAGDTFTSIDNHQAGTLEEGWLFTTSNLINVGDLVQIQRTDLRERKYKVVSLLGVGTTLSVFKKFKLSAAGG